jgi:hypothetical protein
MKGISWKSRSHSPACGSISTRPRSTGSGFESSGADEGEHLPNTLADLTLRMSREISKLEARCAKELAMAERERDQAFQEIGTAKKTLGSYYGALEKAKQAQLREVQAADEARNREVLAAEKKRREQLVREARKHRAARTKALDRRNASVRKAKRKWAEAVKKVKTRPLSGQRRLRKTADEALEAALDEARASYLVEIEEARLAHQFALQDRLVDERLAVEEANRKAERLITGAAIDYERAVASEEARMRRELTGQPEARAVQEKHDRRVASIREACEHAKEALFRRFTQERRGLRH